MIIIRENESGRRHTVTLCFVFATSEIQQTTHVPQAGKLEVIFTYKQHLFYK